MRWTIGLLGVGGIALCVLLTGCGGDSAATDRQAAASESAPIGTKMCVKNNSSKSVDVDFGSTLSTGQEKCTEGASLAGSDIDFNVKVDGVQAMQVVANNPHIGMGSVKLIQLDALGECLYEAVAGKAKGTAKEDGLLRYQFERLTVLITSGDDPQQIEWKLTLSDPGKKSPDGNPVKCS